jgi:hypothetical protein
MTQVKQRTDADFYELINANQMTDELWAEVEAYAQKQLDDDWASYIERKEHFDDAYHRASPYDTELKHLAERKGVVYEWVLVKDGQVVPSVVVKTKYGESWIVKKSWDYDSEIVEWVNVSVASTTEKQQAFYAKKGYQMALATVRGKIVNGRVKPLWSDIRSVEVVK